MVLASRSRRGVKQTSVIRRSPLRLATVGLRHPFLLPFLLIPDATSSATYSYPSQPRYIPVMPAQPTDRERRCPRFRSSILLLFFPFFSLLRFWLQFTTIRTFGVFRGISHSLLNKLLSIEAYVVASSDCQDASSVCQGK